VRVPEDAGHGEAMITLSFAGWKDGQVAAATVCVLVSPTEPKAPAGKAGAEGLDKK